MECKSLIRVVEPRQPKKNSNKGDKKVKKGKQPSRKLGPVLLKYQDGQHYDKVFSPLIIMEIECGKELELTKKVRNLTCVWEVTTKFGMSASIILTDDEKDGLDLKMGKKLGLEYNGSELFNWFEIGKVSKLPGKYDEINRIRISFNKKDKNIIKLENHFTVSLIWNDTKTKRIFKAMEKFTYPEDQESLDVCNTLLGNPTPTSLKPIIIPEGFHANNLPALNSYQFDAMKNAINSPLSLIQGPPGTGKTVTSASLIYGLAKYSNERILVCAPSNTAVDNLAAKIHQTGLNIIRIYAKSLEDEYKKVPFPALHILTKKDGDKDKSIITESESLLLDEVKVILCTCVGAGDKRISHLKFQTVLIDEATQTTEPECLIPIMKGCHRVILVGDHKQLGPVVLHQRAASLGFDQSLFERLIKLNHPVHQLLIQFRMHPSLSRFSNTTFYDGKLLDGIEAEKRLNKKSRFPWPNPGSPLMFYASLGYDSIHGNGTSRHNQDEANKCQDVIDMLMKDGIPGGEIAIITPYTGQRLFITKLLRRKDRKKYLDIEVASIDTFQGREKDYILFSCVRSNPERQTGFLKDPRRLNVAITRARYGLIIIGNPPTLSSSSLWYQLLSHYDISHCLVSGSLSSLHPFPLPEPSSEKHWSKNRKQKKKVALK